MTESQGVADEQPAAQAVMILLRLFRSVERVDTDLTPQHDSGSERAAARNADLTRQNARWSDTNIVRDMHQIVYFGSGTDCRHPCFGSVDTGVGSDLHVVSHLDSSEMRDFTEAGADRQKAETIRA